jgi:NET1-associated nuclear protein 1 (U3 small nucleolar RNA-associated protein 17)
VKGGISVDANASDLRDGEIPSLVYVNSSHEYVVFDPHKNEELVSSKHKARRIQAEESGEFFLLSCYIFLP